ncbi:hypothetical protein HYDPIDRAFT_118831 [Hydnomerulius pinastri MD-312]|uniref:Unplaced genomic scaffold scaffold_64, whole genome shotgun sequence n=1 Tax=Hydnomerulius pinastri MD-312 TaxID=994086 RepID=A0A0C9VZZ1_9AGAM|nr:hypothetical protein HYDPIDRAFT_118831 [Hydnomerulius pinastri MD-312]
MSAPEILESAQPVTPAVSQWLRSFAYTPETKSSILMAGPTHHLSNTQASKSTRKRTRSDSDSEDEDALPVFGKKPGRSTRKNTGKGAKSSSRSVQYHEVCPSSSRRSKKSRSAEATIDGAADGKHQLEVESNSPTQSREATKRASHILHQTVPLRTSKYFTRRCTTPTGSNPFSLPTTNPVLTSPSSPILNVPVYIESSDFEYAESNFSRDDSDGEDIQGELEHVLPQAALSWDMFPGLFDDFMIMLKRLKPILIQESISDDPWKVLIAVRLLNVTTGKVAIPAFCKIIARWLTPQDLLDAPTDELVELLRPLGLYNKRAKWLKDISKAYIEDPPRYPGAESQTAESLPSPTPSSSPTPPPTLSPPTLQTPPPTANQRSPNARRKPRTERPPYPRTPISHFPGVGPYALDSFRIFCRGSLDPDAREDEWKRVMPQDKELISYLRWRWATSERKIWCPYGRGVIGDVDIPYLITLVDELAERYDAAIGGEGYWWHFWNDVGEAWGGGDVS